MGRVDVEADSRARRRATDKAWPPRLSVADGTLEALKWLALVLMTLDHINKYLLHGAVPTLFAMGRLALPLFAFVLSYNLARPRAIENAGVVYPRVLKRLAGTAVVACGPFMALGGLAAGWWPLNILATFAVAVVAMQFLLSGKRGGVAAAVAWVVMGGAFVEYWWPAIAICLAGWYYCRRPSWQSLLAWLLATLALSLNGWAFGAMPIVNGSLWALTALPLIFAAAHIDLQVPRRRWAFYVYYPAHLAAIWMLSKS